MMFHLKPQHPTWERIVHVHSQSLDSGFAVVLPGEVRAVWTSLPWVSSSTKPTSSHHPPATSMALHPPHSPEGLEGWWMKGQGVKPPRSLPTRLSDTPSFQKNADLNTDLSSYRSADSSMSVWKTNALAPYAFWGIRCLYIRVLFGPLLQNLVFFISPFFPLLCSFFSLDLLVGTVCGGMVNY